jgi:exodeoxyribonuclease-3
MKIISWNVNGLRAVLKKGFAEAPERLDADYVLLQETKAQSDQIANRVDFAGHSRREHCLVGIEIAD